MNNKLPHNRVQKFVLIFTVAISICVLTTFSLSTIDWQSFVNPADFTTAQAFDTPPPNEGSPDAGPAKAKEGLSFKKIVTAPVRLFARLFRRSDNPNLAKANNPNANNPTEAKGGVAVVTAIEREAASMFDQAVELHDKKQLDSAIAKLTAVVGMQPNNAEAYNLLGVCYDEKGQFQLSQDEYKKAIKLEPINARFLNNLGYSYYLSGNDKQSIKWYTKALKFTPDDHRVQNNLGLAYGRKGEYAKARVEFVKAVGEHGALLNLGYLYNQQGRYQQAIEQFQEALKLQPNSMITINSLSQVYNRVGRARDAEMLNESYKKLAKSGAAAREHTAEQKNEQEKEEE